MSMENKGSVETKPKFIRLIPEMPRLSVTFTDQKQLDEWWKQVREVLQRMEEYLSR